MTDWLLAQVADWGATALFVVTFLSCLAVPVPSSMMMLTAGAFAASGDLALVSVSGAALTGAVLGDQAGYGLGRMGLQRAEGWLEANTTRAAILARARNSMQRHGGGAVFLSRWMFSVLGPYVNLVAGGAHMRWPIFTIAGVAGEAVWVLLYVGLGYLAGGQLAQAGEMLTNALGLLASLAIAVWLGWLLWRRTHRPSAAD